MKVILQMDVKGSGKAGDIVNVSDGYARNYLFPRGFAVPADASSLNAAKLKKQAEAHRRKVAKDDAEVLARQLSTMPVTIKAKSGENGKLFGSITSKEIAEAFKARYDIELDKKKIVLKEAIKETGEYNVTVKLFAEVSSELKVTVE